MTIGLMLLAAMAEAKYEPPPEIFYPQAVACAVTAKLAGDGKEMKGDKFGELMTWGLILADVGRKAGRTKEQVDSADLIAAEPFYKRLKEKKPKAFAAHRAYCEALLDAERP